jgi:hypothetical protein
MRFRPLRHWIVAVAPVLLAFGQHLALQTPQEIATKPTSEPLPRRFIGVAPLTLYSQILSPSPPERGQAVRRLDQGADTTTSQPVDVRLYAVNLDSDPDLEYVLTAHVWPDATIALVFDKTDRGWGVVGEFRYSWHWSANEAERFISFREIVSHGRKEIIVRERGGGTGVAETRLSIYRMHDGLLYRAFQTIEDSFHWIVGTGTSEYEHRDVEYPEAGGASPVFLIVRSQKRTETEPPSRSVRKTVSCSVFRWNASSVVFEKDQSAVAHLCPEQSAFSGGH